MKNKRFTIFRVFPRLVAKANFGGNMPLKNTIFKILTPLLLLMVQSIIFYIYNQVWDQKVQNVDLQPQKHEFSEKIAIFLKLHFSRLNITRYHFSSTIFALALRNEHHP